MKDESETATSRGPFPPGPAPRKRGFFSSLARIHTVPPDPFEFIAGQFERYGDIYHEANPGGGVYVLRHPDHNREVLVTRGGSYQKRHTGFDRVSTAMLGNGLLNSDGATWRRQRRMIQPSFHPERIAEYSAAMIEESRRLADRWMDGEVYDVRQEMLELTLRIVSRALFSHDASGDADTVRQAVTAITEPDPFPSWYRSRKRGRLPRAIAALDEMMFGLIAERRAAKGHGPTDLLQTLVSAADDEGDGGRLTDREVRDQLVTLLLAGHETTSHALTWTWYLLSQNPEAEFKLHSELREVLGTRPVTYDDLPALVYTEQVFQEAMRLYPPGYLIGRRAREDTEIGGYPVAAGSEVVIWVYLTHHDPRWFPEPEAFRPERFTLEEQSRRPKLAYLPFGAGGRACIGKTFAMAEAKLVLATLAQRYRLELMPDQRVAVQLRITLAPRHGMRMMARAR